MSETSKIAFGVVIVGVVLYFLVGRKTTGSSATGGPASLLPGGDTNIVGALIDELGNATSYIDSDGSESPVQ
jgi:hypothetical protein